jgi:tetratricopeptide (TPR) repeat protein/3',5'-cyclic AMP phosphodiesterase CpdA
VVHLSDLHARSVDGPQAERARREAPLRCRVIGAEWDRNLAAIRDDGVPVDLIVFTGDLADWADATDYTAGVEFLERTRTALDVPRDRLFVVPGNHDIARRTEPAAWRAIRSGFGRAALAGSRWMAGGEAPGGFDDRWRDAIFERQAAFWKAMTVDLGRPELGPWLHPHGRLGYHIQVPLDGLDAPLWVIGLDTSWLAGDDADTGALRLTEHQVELLATDGRNSLPGFRLALMHHRFSDLADGERTRRLLANRVDLVLHGHQHEPAVEPWAGPDHDLLVLAAGCLYEGDDGHRYPNAFQVVDLALTRDGRPDRVAIRFRGWAERNGLFWGDDGLLYRSASAGRLTLRRHERAWVVEGREHHAPRWQPTAGQVFVGRDDELAAIERAISAAPDARVAVVAVQGMAGVGKSFLVEEFCARHAERFGALCRWVLDPRKLDSAEAGLLEIAQQAGLDRDRTPVDSVPSLLADRRALVHIDNVDSAEAAQVVVELLDRLAGLPAIVTGRYTALGATPAARWVRIELECLDHAPAIEVLRAELGDHAPGDADLRDLAAELGGLPLALHLAAGYLRSGFSAAGFLARLRATGLALAPVDRADPSWRARGHGIVSASFQISQELFLAEAAVRGEPWAAALSALGWSAPSGFGRDLGAAITGLGAASFEDFIHVATSLSLVRRVPRAVRPDGAWSVHTLLAELLRADAPRAEVDARVRDWVIAHGDDASDDAHAARWTALSRESAAVHAWLAQVEDAIVSQVVPRCWRYASSHGPVGPWLDAARRACHRQRAERAPLAWAWAQLAMRVGLHDEVVRAAVVLETDGDGARDVAQAAGLRAAVLQACGDLDEALRIRRVDQLPVYERLGDAREDAVTRGQIADILQARGDLDEALRIRRDHELPVYRRLGDARLTAVTLGKIADVLQARGELDEALRIRRVDQLPVYERFGDVRSRAVTLGKVADILYARGELDEALRIRRIEQLPVYERLGDVRSTAVTMGKIADILYARGDLDEALRIRRVDELPVYQRLGDVRSTAVTLGKVADILQARGELDEALRIRRVDQLPVFQRLGDVRATAVAMGKIADILQARGELDEALRIRRVDQLPVYDRLGDVRAKAVTLGKIADIFQARGELDEALEVRRAHELPVYRRLGDVRSEAVTKGKIADILQARGELDDALRIRRDHELPVYERLGDVRLTAVTMGQIADLLHARGDLDEALRIDREDVLPILERQGGRDLLVALVNLGIHLIRRGAGDDLAAARSPLARAAAMAREMHIPFPEPLAQWLASSAGRDPP